MLLPPESDFDVGVVSGHTRHSAAVTEVQASGPDVVHRPLRSAVAAHGLQGAPYWIMDCAFALVAWLIQSRTDCRRPVIGVTGCFIIRPPLWLQ